MSEENKFPRVFVLIDDPAQATKLLEEAINANAPNLFWTQSHPTRNRGNFQSITKTDKTFFLRAPKNIDPNIFLEKLVTVGVAHVYFSVSLRFTSILFKAHFLGEKDGVLGFKFPEKIYTTQRRKDQRITLRESYVVKADFNFAGGVEKFKIYDISIGGIALDVDDAEADRFRAGDLHAGVKFVLVERPMNVDLQVRHMRSNRYDKSRAIVGLKFTKIDHDSLEYVGNYVEDEALYTNTLDTINLFRD